MTVTAINTQAEVSVAGDAITIRELAIHNGEAAALARAQLEQTGPAGLADAIRRAVPVGLVALALSAASVDSGSLQRTLDGFAHDVDARSQAALTGLDEVLTRLEDGEQAIQQAAQRALEQLPARLDRALGGEAASVRQAVTGAAQAVHAATLDEVRRALDAHSRSVRQALSLDTDGPVQMLRRDVLGHLDDVRRELAEQMTVVREMLRAAEAGKAAAARSTRAVGAAFEAEAASLAERIVTAAGDRWEDTGSHPAPGTTSRVGDGVATLTSAITGRTPVRIVFEAKQRSKPLTAAAWRTTLAEARNIRSAAGAIALVPAAAQLPGGNGLFCRVDERCFVVVADTEPAALVYLVLRELVALITVGQHDGDEVDLAKLDAQLNAALAALSDFDEVARLTNAAMKNLDNVKQVGSRARTRIHDALNAGLSTLHS